MNLRPAIAFSTIVIASALVVSALATTRVGETAPPSREIAAMEKPTAAHSFAPSRKQTIPSSNESPALAPPPVLFIQREVIAKGKMDDQNEVARKILAQYQDHHLPFNLLGMTSIAPNRDEVLAIVAYPSFAAIDDLGKQFSSQPEDFLKTVGELREQENSLAESKIAMIASFRPDLSYRADWKAVAQARLFLVDQFIVPLGHMPDYESDVKFMKTAARKANMDEHYFVYQTVAGAESQTIIVFRPLKSFADWDKAAATAAALDHVLDDTGKKHLARIWNGAALQGPGQSVDRLYNLRPDLSITSPEFAAFDPDFWRPKTQ